MKGFLLALYAFTAAVVTVTGCVTAGETQIENSGEIPYDGQFMNTPPAREQREYGPSDGSLALPPFLPGYETADYHLMAFFNGHKDYEAVECTVRNRKSGGPDLFVILTYHDNTQEYYVNNRTEEETKKNVTKTYICNDIVFNVNKEETAAYLKFSDKNGNIVELDYTGYASPDPDYSLVADSGEHNRENGLVLGYVAAAGIAVPETCVTINGKQYEPMLHPSSQPPYWTAYMSFLSREFHYVFFNRISKGKSKKIIKADAGSIRNGEFSFRTEANKGTCTVVYNNAVPETASLSMISGNPDFPGTIVLNFNPPFPNLNCLRSEKAQSKFSVNLPGREEAFAYGIITVAREVNGDFIVEMEPEYPGWAAKIKTRYHVDTGQNEMTVWSEVYE